MSLDTSDRIKIKSLAALLGDVWEEAENFLYVPAWGKVFSFSVRENVEFVFKVDMVY